MIQEQVHQQAKLLEKFDTDLTMLYTLLTGLREDHTELTARVAWLETLLNVPYNTNTFPVTKLDGD